MLLDVMIPTIDNLPIVKGSGMVAAHARPRDLRWLYFEGNVVNAINLVEFESRLACAAGRLVQTYPTIARMAITPESVGDYLCVGTYDTRLWRWFVDPAHAERVSEWIGEVRHPVEIQGKDGQAWYVASRFTPEERRRRIMAAKAAFAPIMSIRQMKTDVYRSWGLADDPRFDPLDLLSDQILDQL